MDMTAGGSSGGRAFGLAKMEEPQYITRLAAMSFALYTPSRKRTAAQRRSRATAQPCSRQEGIAPDTTRTCLKNESIRMSDLGIRPGGAVLANFGGVFMGESRRAYGFAGGTPEGASRIWPLAAEHEAEGGASRDGATTGLRTDSNARSK